MLCFAFFKRCWFDARMGQTLLSFTFTYFSTLCCDSSIDFFFGIRLNRIFAFIYLRNRLFNNFYNSNFSSRASCLLIWIIVTSVWIFLFSLNLFWQRRFNIWNGSDYFRLYWRYIFSASSLTFWHNFHRWFWIIPWRLRFCCILNHFARFLSLSFFNWFRCLFNFQWWWLGFIAIDVCRIMSIWGMTVIFI